MRKNNEFTNEEKLIKSKRRVQLHGEVMSPKWLVNKMLDTPGIKEETENLESTFLEPSAGEGAFLVEILKRKLNMVESEYNDSLVQFENYSLYALSTIYGIELLDDNLSACLLNMYDTYYKKYLEVLGEYDKAPKQRVLDSAKLIIKTNIVQGDFLKRTNDNGNEIIFSQWEALDKLGKNKTIKVTRTEYTLNEIMNQDEKKSGNYMGSQNSQNYLKSNQLSFFESIEESKDEKVYNYKECKITDVCLELMEEI